MAKKIVNKRLGVHVLLTKAGRITLNPGPEGTVVPDHLYEAAKETKVTYGGKEVSALDMLQQEGQLEITDAPASEGVSQATRGEIPPALQGGLSGQGGWDATQRDDEKKRRR